MRQNAGRKFGAVREDLLKASVFCLAFLAPELARGATPSLHERIDREIESKLDAPPAASATDSEFLRRVYLDLTGMSPSAKEARAFIDDPSPYKRPKLVDRLLESPDFARRMQYVFDVMIMERRPDIHVPSEDWRKYLRDSFLANKPYDRLAREILSADGADPETRAAAKFFLDREVEPNLVTKDVARVFFGMDITCCQCHDHPIIDAYKQQYFYGIYAVVSRGSLFTDEATKKAVVAEKVGGEVPFTSVFKKKVTHKTGPRLIEAAPIAEPPPTPGLEYWIAPGDRVRALPKSRGFVRLASHATSNEAPEFARNIVNRLWAMMLGRGLSHPVDLLRADAPPSHPELLDLLANEFVARKYDVKAFLREIALTRVYQRSSEPPPESSESLLEPSKFAVAAFKPLSPEQLCWSLLQATGILESNRAEAARLLDGVDPRMQTILASDSKRKALRADLIEAETYRRLGGNVGPFVEKFGSVAGQARDVGDPTVHQALFLTNGEPVNSWLSGNFAPRLAAIADPSALADELYLSLLSRRPSEDERALVADHLAKRGKDRNPAILELAWSITTSIEFRFNH